MGWIGVWWRQSDHYEWLSNYLDSRGLRPFVRYLLAAIESSMAMATGLLIYSSTGADRQVEFTAALLVSVSLAVMATVWLLRWPTRAQSTLFAVAGTIGIAVVAVIQDNPSTGMVVCAAFGGLAGYVAFFHSARILIFTLGAALFSAAYCAVRVAAGGDLAVAAALFIFLSAGLLAVPFCGQILVTWLSNVALKSSTDPLTGLRNRRGLDRSTPRLVVASKAKKYLSALMIDLDDFKTVNDTRGHAVGDRILSAVAASLRSVAREDALIARVGGEEFVVVQPTNRHEALETAEAMRSAVAATHWGVTVSIGITTTRLTPDEDPSCRQRIQNLIEVADAAMYAAKRAGGNQICHADSPPSPEGALNLT